MDRRLIWFVALLAPVMAWSYDALCLRLQRGCGMRGWGRDGLGTGARGRGAEGVDVDYAPARQ